MSYFFFTSQNPKGILKVEVVWETSKHTVKTLLFHSIKHTLKALPCSGSSVQAGRPARRTLWSYGGGASPQPEPAVVLKVWSYFLFVAETQRDTNEANVVRERKLLLHHDTCRDGGVIWWECRFRWRCSFIQVDQRDRLEYLQRLWRYSCVSSAYCSDMRRCKFEHGSERWSIY